MELATGAPTLWRAWLREAGLRTDHDSAGFNDAEGETVASDFKLQRITERCGTERPNQFAIGQAHLQQPHGAGIVSFNIEDRRGLAFGELIECLRQRKTPSVISRNALASGSLHGKPDASAFRLRLWNHRQGHQNLGLVVHSQAETMIPDGNDAGPARLDHHDANLLSQTHLGQPVNYVWRPIHLDHMANLASRHQVQRDDVFQDKAPKRFGRTGLLARSHQRGRARRPVLRNGSGILGPQRSGTTEFSA